MKVRFVALSATAGAALAIGGVVVPAAAVAAPRVTSIELTSSNLSMTSATGQHLKVQVHAFVNANQPQDNEADITLWKPLGVGGSAGEEDHTWTFPIQYSELKTNAAGKGTLDVASAELSPFGVMSLTMTPTQTDSIKSCNGSPSISTTRVKLAGTFFFSSRSTGAHKWGSVGSHSAKKPVTFTGKNTLVQVFPGTKQCLNTDANPPCMSGVMWDSGNSKVDVSGVIAAGREVVDAARLVGFATGAGTAATREDDLIAPMSPPLWAMAADRLNPSAQDATLITRGSSPTSIGSASLTSTIPVSIQSVPCGTAGKSELGIAWPAVQYTNGATPLTFKPQVFGPIHAPNNTDAMVLALGGAIALPSTPAPSLKRAEQLLRGHQSFARQGRTS
ncbi:MAG TPA: hypothetical protein VHB18_10860 [Mycobacteriales bacterium]|jgi:hypothetical protein|nr:hypothetical protein [Mycobacteriales bacterium]